MKILVSNSLPKLTPISRSLDALVIKVCNPPLAAESFINDLKDYQMTKSSSVSDFISWFTALAGEAEVTEARKMLYYKDGCLAPHLCLNAVICLDWSNIINHPLHTTADLASCGTLWLMWKILALPEFKPQLLQLFLLLPWLQFPQGVTVPCNPNILQAHFSWLSLLSDLMLNGTESFRKVPDLISSAVDVLSSPSKNSDKSSNLSVPPDPQSDDSHSGNSNKSSNNSNDSNYHSDSDGCSDLDFEDSEDSNSDSDFIIDPDNYDSDENSIYSDLNAENDLDGSLVTQRPSRPTWSTHTQYLKPQSEEIDSAVCEEETEVAHEEKTESCDVENQVLYGVNECDFTSKLNVLWSQAQLKPQGGSF